MCGINVDGMSVDGMYADGMTETRELSRFAML